MQTNDLSELENFLHSVHQKAIEREKEKSALLTSDKSFVNNSLINSCHSIIIDSREQVGYRYLFPNFSCSVKALNAGDYSISPFENQVAIERKTLDDYISTIIHNRERFETELTKLETYENKAIVVEASYSDIVNHNYTSKAHPNSIIGLTHSLSYKYNIPVYFLQNNILANRFTLLYLQAFARKKQREEIKRARKKEKVSLLAESDCSEQLPLTEINLDNTVFTLSLPLFIQQVTDENKKQTFKEALLATQYFPSTSVLLECTYTDILNLSNANQIEKIIISLIIDYNIDVVFLENWRFVQEFKYKRLSRYK